MINKIFQNQNFYKLNDKMPSCFISWLSICSVAGPTMDRSIQDIIITSVSRVPYPRTSPFVGVQTSQFLCRLRHWGACCRHAI